VDASAEYTVRIPYTDMDANGVGYCSFSDTVGSNYIRPVYAPDTLFSLAVTGATAVSKYPASSISSIPMTLKLYGNYPNPFNNATKIRFTIPSASTVQIDIYSILGKHVKSVFQGLLPMGSSTKDWNGTNDAGRQVASGIYLCRVKTNSGTLTTKMVLLK
jgi:hypothetical protein